MAIFQPTNIIPSSYTKGTVDVNDTMEIAWQVNGNSAMTAFQIDFYLNDYDSTPVYSTGRLTDNIPTGGFYGTDRFGKPQFFTWNSRVSWEDKDFTNGNEYKYKITQFYQESNNEKSLQQTSFSVFKTRTAPTLVIYQTDSQFQNGKPLQSILQTSIGYFQAQYIQAQGDPIRWVRWQVATANNGTVGDILQDTGDIYTPTLDFEFNGFFNEQQYSIRCFGESESGQQCDTGQVYFKIQLTDQGEYFGAFDAQYICAENAIQLEWTSEALPPSMVQGTYKLNESDVFVSSASSIMWESGIEPFESPWTAAFSYSLTNTDIFKISALRETVTIPYTVAGAINSVEFTNQSNVKDISYFLTSDRKTCYVTLVPFNNPGPALPAFAQINIQSKPIGQLSDITTSSRFALSISFQTEGDRYICKVFDFGITQTTTYIFDLPWTISYLTVLAFSKSPTFPNGVVAYGDGELIEPDRIGSSSKSHNTITNIKISGGESGGTFNSVTIYKEVLNLNLLSSLYANPTQPIYKPSWNSSLYSLYMTANFNNSLDAGQGSSFRIYRQEVGKNFLQPIYYDTTNSAKLKDYGIKSRKVYSYWLFKYDSNNAFLKGVQCKVKNKPSVTAISTSFTNYSLMVCDYDETNDEYHVRRQYLFALNLSVGSVGNNNSPTLNTNFTRYPTRMPSTQNYVSGTLQGLIGAIYTVPALIEQIGNYKWTAKPSTMDYFDSVDLEKELYDLSTAPYQLFLRDMKGRLRMIATNSAITMTTNIKQKQQSISISFPWVEIGDASDVTIIQTPDDYGWNNDNQVLDVSLDVDVSTGELSATYPFPYNGTKFYLTGVNKENLTAKTPLGVTPAQFNLSDTATETIDGEVTATVTVKSEDD